MIHADRNLLFGILAVQMNFVSRDALISGMNAWVLAKHRALGRILVEQGALAAARHDLLERLVDEHLAVHEGDAERSLAAADRLGAVCSREVVAGAQTEPEPIPSSGAGRLLDVEETLTLARDPAADSLRFAILRPHARGGLGQVSVALDRELNREVALKE